MGSKSPTEVGTLNVWARDLVVLAGIRQKMPGTLETTPAAMLDDKLKFVGQSGRRISVIRPPSFSLKNLRSDLTKLWQYFDLLHTLSVHRIKVRYKQSLLG